MEMYNYKGITTNNLKDISVGFNDHEVIYVGGVSGSGKSSLAFDTIAAISESEYRSIVNDNKVSNKFRVKEYGTVLVAATLKQLNFNVNPRSIIMTYFGLYPHVSNILAQCTGITADNFSLNGKSRCPVCNGVGYVDYVDESLIVDMDKKLSDGPFLCWNNTYIDFFSQLLHNFCQEVGIDENYRFYDLKKEQQNLLLRTMGSKKYKIIYKAGNRTRSKTSAYIGPLLGLETNRNYMFGMNREKYLKQHICPVCKGSRIASTIKEKEVINGVNVEYILTGKIGDIEGIIEKIKHAKQSQSISDSCNYILKFIKECKGMGVSHLNFSRSISSLSGGELQRLRMVQLLLGRLKNLLIVLDEPTSSLDSIGADSVIAAIKKLRENNTIIVVDHNYELRKIADRAFFLGPGSGKNGGTLIPESDYIESQKVTPIKKMISEGKAIFVRPFSDYVKFENKLTIYEKTLNGICGRSGIGKTTILRDVLPYQMDRYKYISQKPIKAGRISSVASFCGLLDEIRDFYSNKTKTNKSIFSLNKGGACSKCRGKGSIIIAKYNDEHLYIDCDECGGTGYTQKVLSYLVDGLNIHGFLEQSIDAIISNNTNLSNKFNNKIRLLSNLGLGHLSLNQKTNTLSGGENQRLKLSQALGNSSIMNFGLDEPSKGLGRKEIYGLINIIYENIKCFGKTFIIAEHNEDFLKMCSHVNELIEKNAGVYIKAQK